MRRTLAASMSAITLYHIGPSLFSQIVRLALAEKHVEYTSRVVDIGPRMENYEPWYVRKNPRMVVPTLEITGPEGSVIVTDALRIIVWIDDNLHGPPLMPADRDARGEVEAWLTKLDGLRVRELFYGTMPGPLATLAPKAVGKRLAVLERHRERNPELAAAYDERIADVRAWRATIVDRAQVQAIQAELDALLGELEAALREHEFLVGDRYTLADVVWTVMLARLHMLRRTAALGPSTRHYHARMRARASFFEADIWERVRIGFVLRTLVGVLRLPSR